MTEETAASSTAEHFRTAFEAVSALMREEWRELDAAALAETAGDLEKAVALVAKATDRTKVAVRRQIEELVAVAQRSAERGANVNGTGANGAGAKPGFAPPKPSGNLDLEDVLSAVRRLESFASDEAKRVGKSVVPGAESKIKENLWVSLLFALGLGMILGLWLNGRRRS